MTTTPAAGTPAAAWRVLIVDDSPDDRAEVRRLLLRGSERRYLFVEIGDGEGAVRAARDVTDGRTHCIILDYNLPDMNAVEVLARLCGADGLTICPVVVLTGAVSDGNARAVLREGAQDYLDKAWMTQHSLTRAVENAMERWDMARELRAREDSLRASEEKLRLAVEASATGLWTWDVHTDVVTWSKECYAIHGVADGAFGNTGVAFFGLVHEDDRARVEATVKQAIRDHSLYECEFRIVRPDGSESWVGNRGRCSYDDAGQPLSVLGTLTDISDRKRAEVQLQRNHQTFAHLVDNNPFGVYVVDAEFRLRQVSVGARKAFAGISPLIGRDFDEVLSAAWPEPFAAEVSTRFRNTLATGVPYAEPSSEERRADSGDVEAYDWRIERVSLPDGRYGVVCYFYDLSERKRWESTLQATRDELRSITDNTPDVITRFSSDLRHVFVNAAIQRATGRPPEEIIGKTNRELDLPSPLCDLWDASTRSVFDSGTPTAIEFEFDGPSGTRHFRARLIPEFGSDGSVQSVLAVTHDTTDRVRAEAAVRESEERMRMALAASRAGAWEWDVETGRLSWSAEMFALYGLDKRNSPLVFADWEARVHPDDVGRASAAVRDALEKRASEFHSEFRIEHPVDG